jgi:hypothetical protein
LQRKTKSRKERTINPAPIIKKNKINFLKKLIRNNGFGMITSKMA